MVNTGSILVHYAIRMYSGILRLPKFKLNGDSPGKINSTTKQLATSAVFYFFRIGAAKEKSHFHSIQDVN